MEELCAVLQYIYLLFACVGCSAVQDLFRLHPAFENEKELDGVSWNGTKEQLANHKYVIQGIIAASDMMREDAYTLASSVGNEVLDEDELKEKLCTQKTIRIEAQKSVNNYRVKNGKSLADGTVTNYSGIISIYLSTISICESLIDGYENKLDKLEAIENRTSSLFLEATDLFNAVQNVNATLGGSWNGSSFTATVPEEYISLIKGAWENTKVSRELRQAGITFEQIQNMKELGYTAEDVLNIWENCETEVDKDFFKCLMTGTAESYEKAFSLDPLEVSDYMMMIAADYSIRIFEIDEEGNLTPAGKKAFEDFNNALFLSANMQCKSMPFLHSNVYLEKIYAYVSELTMGLSVELASMEPKEDTYDQLYNELVKRIGLVNLWGSEIMFKDTLLEVQVATGILKISLTDYTNGEIDFKLGHYSLWDDGYKEQTLETDILWFPNDQDNVWTLERLEKLSELREDILKDTIISAVQGAVLAGLGILSPYAAIAGGIVFMGMNGEIQSLPELSNIELGTVGKAGVDVVNATVPEILNGMKKWLDANDALTEEQWKVKMEWFGTGGKCTILPSNEWLKPLGDINIVQGDIYDPDVIRGIYVWETRGIAGWMGWESDPSFVEAIEEEIRNNQKLTKEEEEECIKLLKGGCDIYGLENMDQFGTRIEVIQDCYSVVKGGPGKKSAINIQDKWRGYISCEVLTEEEEEEE